MFGWLFNRLGNSILSRTNQRKCERCKLPYNESLSDCPHCSGLDDTSLTRILNKRRKERIGIATFMLLIAALFVVFLFLPYFK